MFRQFGAGEILLILVLVLLLFGAKRLPDAARGLGRSLRIFKSEVGAMTDDDKSATTPKADEAGTTSPEPTDRSADSESNGSR